MVYPQIFNVLEGHLDGGPTGFDGPGLDDDPFLLNTDFMTDMQQQQQVANRPNNSDNHDINGLGLALDNLNPNILMNTFQAPQQQEQTTNDQQGRIQGMSIQDVAAAFTAPVGNGSNNNNTILPDQDLFGNALPVVVSETTASSTSPTNNIVQVQQPNAFGGLFGGLEQLQGGNNNTLQQTTTNQPTTTNGNGLQSQQTLVDLQRQLASLQHQAQQQLIQHPQHPQQQQQRRQEHQQQQNLDQNQQGLQSLLGGYNMNNDPNLNPTPLPFPAWGDFGEGNNNNNNNKNFQYDLTGKKMPPQLEGKQRQPIDNNHRRAPSLSSERLLPVNKNNNSIDPPYVVGGNGNGGGGGLGSGNLNGIFNPDSMPTSPGENSSSTDSPQGSSLQRKTTSRRRTRAKTFPEKLMSAMLEYTDETAVAWLPDGKSFVIVNPDMFCEDVLKKGFKESKYSSFVRKLHRWGFIRLTSGTGTDCFHHPMFQKDRMDMCSKIKCTPPPKNDKDKDKPVMAHTPSLTGVEKFIRAKVLAAAASAAARAEERMLRNRSAEEAEEEELDLSGGEDGL